MCYEVEGSGPPMLLIMGTAASHDVWAAQVEAYRGDYTVITYDARGTGQSTHTEDPTAYTMRSLADDAAALLHHLDCGPVRLAFGAVARLGDLAGVRHQPSRARAHPSPSSTARRATPTPGSAG